MQKTKVIILLSILAKLAISIPIEDYICPDSHPENCYPKVFEPTEEWQIVKQGQDIPGGLHVRLNMETHEREAKILDNDDLQEAQQELQVIPVETVEEENEASKLQNLGQSYKPNKKVTLEDKGLFSQSVNTLDAYVEGRNGISEDQVLESLNNLEELSHELDFGIALTQENVFSSLLKAACISTTGTADNYSLQIQEIALRIIAGSLRNNPIAIQNILKPDQKPSSTLNEILKKLKTTKDKVIQKRILGILSGYIQDPQGADLFKLNDGENKILISFNDFSEDGQIRALQILDDVKENQLQERSTDESEESSLTQDDIDKKYFALLQDKLINNSDHVDFKKLFMQMAHLKEKTKATIKADSNFINWLIDEAERRKNDPVLVKRDNEDNDNDELDESFAQYMIKVRHVLFGNPMAHRKAFMDEL